VGFAICGRTVERATHQRVGLSFGPFTAFGLQDVGALETRARGERGGAGEGQTVVGGLRDCGDDERRDEDEEDEE